jgi:membrane protein
VAGLLWISAGSLFADFMAGSTRYAAIYSSLAIPILFMMWVYIAWLIVLIGANIAFYLQYPEYLAAGSAICDPATGCASAWP